MGRTGRIPYLSSSTERSVEAHLRTASWNSLSSSKNGVGKEPYLEVI